jgi:hypothetical protein
VEPDREDKATVQGKTNIQIDNKIKNRQSTIVKVKCPSCKKERKTCPVRKKRKVRKRLIQIHRCVPIQQKCDAIQRPVFVSATSQSIIKFPSGTITILNTSDACTMKIKINRKTGDHGSVSVGPNSSFTATVANLKSVEILCTGNSKEECTGTINLDLFFIVEF